MKTDTPPKPDSATQGRDQGMLILSYLIAGIAMYGGLGWLADRFLQTSFLLPSGLVLGMGVSLYIIIKRYGRPA